MNSSIDYLGSTNSSTRATFGGGKAGGHTNVIDFVEIATTGNASDFGDLTTTKRFCAGSSDVHGGLAQ